MTDLDKIREWYERLSKEMKNAPSYIFRDTIQVIKEMGEYSKREPFEGDESPE